MFISLEGTEGAGKSTLIQKLKQYFEQQGREVVIAREPGGTPVAEEIRSLLIKPGREEVFSPDAEMLLFFAGRCQNIVNIIQPALDQAKVVIFDRYTDSTYSYQIKGRGMDADKFNILQKQFVTVMPDITLWLDLEVDIGMQRAGKRGELDRFELEKHNFFNKVREGFAELHAKDPGRIKRIDASQSEDRVFECCIAELVKGGI